MANVATDFEKIIQEGRDRKKNELLAKKIFSKDRRQSDPLRTRPGTGPSLASRVGVKKRVSSLGPKPGPSRGNIDGEWAHDLHASVNPAPSSLASRISQPGRPHSTRRAAQIASALMKQESQSDIAQASTTTPVAPPTQPKGISIRGLAGPFAVMAQNFAPGTTAADIESAMTPVGGEMLTCIILKTEPIVVAEMVFASREGGERVIATFNNQTADSRVIRVYPKPGGYQPPTSQRNMPPANAPNGPRAYRMETRSGNNYGRDQVVDGSMGFSEPMNTDEAHYDPEPEPNGGLYSDKLVGRGRRGREPYRARGRR